MSIRFEPIQDNIAIQRVEEKEVSRSGIIIPSCAQEKPQEGIVVAVGKGKFDKKGVREPLSVKVGDSVLFGKYAGAEVKIDDAEFLIMKEKELTGIIIK